MNLNLFLAFCDIDYYKIIFVCDVCGIEYSYIDITSKFDLNDLFVRAFDVCMYSVDDYRLMVNFKYNGGCCIE